MEPYIWGYKNNVHLIDISKTAQQLERAAQFLKDLASQNKTILWIGTKKPAQEVITAVAQKLDMPCVSHRWIGGTLSNFAQVKKSVTKYLHYKDILAKADTYPHYTKKELNTIQKAADRLENNVGGIVNLAWPVGAIVVVDVNKERSALREAATVGVPVVALVDTNADPALVDFVIPGNDDSPRAISVVMDYLADAVAEGKQVFAQEAKNAKEKGAVQKAARVKSVEVQESYEQEDGEETSKEEVVAKKSTTKKMTARPKRTIKK